MATNYQKAKEKAAWLIEKYALTLPFSVFELGELLRIGSKELSPENLFEVVSTHSPEELEHLSPDDILGFYDASNNTVYINEKQPFNRKRFTMAHEIGHQQLHRSSDKNHFRKSFAKRDLVQPDSENEVEANYFAGYLLAPDEFIEKVLPYTKLMMGGDFMIRELGRLLGLSRESTRIRLKTFKQENPEIWEEYDLSRRLF